MQGTIPTAARPAPPRIAAARRLSALSCGAVLLCCAWSAPQLGCRLFSAEVALDLGFPELPAHWQACFGEVSWVVVVPGSGTALELPAGQPVQRIVVPKLQHQPVLAFPAPDAGGCHLPPAVGIFPLDLSADGSRLHLSWEQGPAGQILLRLIGQGLDVQTLNVPRLCREIRSRFPADPWRLDLDEASAALVSGSFRVTQLRPLAARTVILDFGPGRWFLESPFSLPVEVPPEGIAGEEIPGIPLTLPEVPVGLHHLFELETGWTADLWVGQDAVLWIAAPVCRTTAELDTPGTGAPQ